MTEARQHSEDGFRPWSSTHQGRLAECRVAIVGLGLMGGSLALALRGRCAELIGVDHDPAAVALARERGVVDFATPELESGLRHCHLIVLATPVRAILDLLARLPDLISNPVKGGASSLQSPDVEKSRLKASHSDASRLKGAPTNVENHASGGLDAPAKPAKASTPSKANPLPLTPVSVLDLGSTKSAIIEAMQALPTQFDPIGGHPMCGREVAGLAHADAGLFRGQTFILVPLERTSDQTKQLALEVVEAVGARALELDAARHDALTAATSHLPYAAAAALVGAAQALQDEGTWQVAASGFRDSTRLAASDLTMMVDILLTNRPAILAALARFRGELDRLGALIEAGDAEAMRAALLPAQAQRRELFK